jgi:hypothetical protein
MTDPRRLLESSPVGLERELLEAGRDDLVPDAARERIWAGVAGGLGVALAGSTGTAVASGATGAAAAGATAAPGAATVVAVKVGFGALKYWGLGLLGGALLVGGAAYTLDSSPAPAVVASSSPPRLAARAPASAVVPTPAEPPLEVTEPPSEVTEPPSEVTQPQQPQTAAARLPGAKSGTRSLPAPPREPVAEPPPQPAPSVSPGPSIAAVVPPAPPALALKREVELLDGARRALRVGDSEQAERALREHAREFGGGVLGPEAEVLRMEVLLKRGDRAGAAAAARSFLARVPKSPHAGRVRALLAAATGP